MSLLSIKNAVLMLKLGIPILKEKKRKIIMNQNKSNVKHISNSSCVCASPSKSQNRTNGGIKF